jgi:glycosyltransferase involved in cell wall biosynthesis
MMHVSQLIKKTGLVLLSSIMCIYVYADYNPFLRNYTDSPELVVLVTSYNNEKFFYRNLDSIVHQKLDMPFHIIYVDDCSSDKTGSLVDSYIKTHNLESQITVIHNQKRVGALANQYTVVNTLPDHVIVAFVDGDDYLAHDRVVESVLQTYANKNIWLAYSKFIYYPEGWIIGKECLEQVVEENSFRDNEWVSSHLKTCYAGLFKRIQKESLLYHADGGQPDFFEMTGDLAFMFPMLEMASKGHIAFIPDVLYVYNHHNPISDHNKDVAFQTKLCCLIRKLSRYKPIESNQ